MDDYANYNNELYQMNTSMYQMNNGADQNSPRVEQDEQKIDNNEQSYDSFFNVENNDMDFVNYKGNGNVRTGTKDQMDSLNFNMVGDFKNYDSMELDESPPLNVDIDAYYNPLLDPKAVDGGTKSLFNTGQARAGFNNKYDNLEVSQDTYQTEQIPKVTSEQNFAPQTDTYVNMNSFRENVPIGTYGDGALDIKDFNSYNNNNNYGNNDSLMAGNRSVSNASININNANNYYNELSPLTTTTSLTPSATSVHSTQPSFFSAQQYITRNSMEQPPSYHRPSIDAYSKARASFDSQHSSVNQRQRTQVGGRYTSFTNSISNYIPFMSDRNQRTSNNSTPSDSVSPSPPQSSAFINNSLAQPQQSRHLIRSIFKSSTVPNNTNTNNAESNFENSDLLNGDINLTVPSNRNNNNINNVNNIETEPDLFLINNLQQDQEDDNMETSLATKKAKRTKRSLFTRFKTPVKSEPNDDSTEIFKSEDGSNNKSNMNKAMSNENIEAEIMGVLSSHGFSMNGTPSIDSSNVLIGTNLDTSTLNTSNNNIGNSLLEPDYAALFEKVGKRKNIVNPAAYIRTKPKYKNEPSDASSINGSTNNSNSNTEKSSIQNYNSSGSYSENIDPRNINSIHSNDSSINNKVSYSEEGISDSDISTSVASNSNTPTSLATASKRILGSKLMLKRKTSQANITTTTAPVTTINSKGMEVEVDLESLDLPPTTQIFPTNIINSKSRTRGRKENKEADLVDLSKIYLCNYCSRRFKRQEHLKRHFRSLHTFEKPYDCSICHKKFSRSDNLNQHLKIHKQEAELAEKGLSIRQDDKVKSEESL